MSWSSSSSVVVGVQVLFCSFFAVAGLTPGDPTTNSLGLEPWAKVKNNTMLDQSIKKLRRYLSFLFLFLFLCVSAGCCNQPTRHNIKQQDELNTINKHTAVLLLLLLLLLKVHIKRYTIKYCGFSGTPHARNNNVLNKKKLRGNTN